jgi:hypothetical protein
MSARSSPRSPAVFFRAVRIFHGWSREALAQRTQPRVSPERIARLESGAVPTVEELDALWRAFKGAPVETVPLEETAR